MQNIEAENLEKAYSYSIYLLSLKLRTEGEIRNKLQIKNYKLQIIDSVVQKLKENQYIDDQRYAEVYVENLKKYKTFGYYGIKKKLMEKRLPAGIIEQVLDESLSEEEEIKIAKRYLIKYEAGNMKQEAKVQKKDELYQVKQKLAKKLASRGFRTEVVMQIIL